MTEIVLFHHALGLTPGVVAFADGLRAAGHTVHTPDLFAGRTFATLEEGVRHAEEIGFGEVVERGGRAVDELPAELVYAGFSLGVLPAQKLAQTRAGARGAILFSSCVPVTEFGAAWPGGVPVQIHGMDADPFFVGEGDLDAARALVAEADDGELFLYPGDGHLFADRSLPSYDAAAAGVLTERVLGFLAGVTEPGAGGAPMVASPPTTDLDEYGRPEPPLAGDEIATILGFLEYQRATLAWKCRGLGAAGLSATVGASSLTLGGMLKHLAYVEDYWFSQRLHGRDWQPPLDTVDWPPKPSWDWHFTSAAKNTPDELHALWQTAVSRSRTMVDAALAEGGLDVLARQPWPNGESPSLRWIVVHMIEEYARHNGHADLIRESVDGQSGE